jgi:hypothetical protein
MTSDEHNLWNLTLIQRLPLGNEAFSFGLPEEAEEHFLRSLRFNETPGAHYNLGVLYHAIEKHAEAELDLTNR